MDDPKCKRGKVAVACPPDDSLVEIFSRLHAKPLFRFKCVSKDWCSLIADRLRCRKFPQTLEGFLASSGVENYGDFIDLSGRPVPLIDPSFAFLTKLPEIEKIILLDSCNGLVLFGHTRVSDWYDSLGYIVCNPATEEWVSVPIPVYTQWAWVNIDSEDDEYNQEYAMDTYLVFDPTISPHFQLIQFRLGDLFDLQEVFSFSSATGAWRRRSFSPVSEAWRLEFDGVLDQAADQTMVMDIIGACPFNGMLHLNVGVQQPHNPFENQNMILAVGGEGRPSRTLHWPQNDCGVPVFVGQSQDHLHCLSGCTTEVSQITELSIWVLEDYNAEKWALRDNVSFSQLFGRMSSCCHVDWNVVGIIVTKFLGRWGRGTRYATYERFLHFGSKMNPRTRVEVDEPGSRVEGGEPVFCDYGRYSSRS